MATGTGKIYTTALVSAFNAEIDFKSTYEQGSKFFIKFNLNDKMI